MDINTIQFITEGEVKAMPIIDFEITRSQITNKNTNVKRDSYSAVAKLDRLTSFRWTISNDDYALFHYFSGRNYISDQFSVKGHIRIIETKWPERNGQKAHSSYRIDLYATEDLKWSFDITRSQFLAVYQAGLKSGNLAYLKPIEHIPGSRETEVKVEAKAEEMPF